jgi:hypothetical protein
MTAEDPRFRVRHGQLGFAASIRTGSFGFRTVIFAGPIAVIVFVAVNKLYVRDSLGERTVLPGKDKAKS